MSRQASAVLPTGLGLAPIAIMRRCAMTLAVLLISGCQAKTEPLSSDRLMAGLTVVSPALDGLLASAQEVKQQLADDAVITIHCASKQVQCHYPYGFERDEWVCIVNHDENEDGLIDRNEFVYGADAEARLSRCVRSP